MKNPERRRIFRSASDLRTIRSLSLLINAAGFCFAVYLRRITPHPYSRSVGLFRNQFIVMDTSGTLLCVLILLATFFVLVSRRRAEQAARFFASRRFLVAGLTAVLLSAGAVWIYRVYPLSMDEYAPLFQARVFARGQLAAQFPPPLIERLFPPRAIGHFFSVSPADGRVVSRYWPGFALLLTPFVKWHAAWLLNPLLAMGSLLLIWRITRRVFDSDAAAGLAVLFAVASPAFTINAISLFSMNAHLFFNLAFVALLLRPTPRRILAAGLAGSVAVILHNPLSHLLFALPWIVWLGVRPRRARNLALLGIGYLPLTVGVGVAWVLYREAVAGAGGAFSLPEILSGIAGGGTWLVAPSLRILVVRFMCLVKICSWAVPGLVVLAVFGGWRWRREPVVRLLAASAVLTFLAYFFVRFTQGHGWGYRYFHSVWGVLPIFAAGALLKDRGPRAAWRKNLLRFAVTAALLSLVLGTTLRAVQVERYISRRLAELPAAPAEGRAVCFINTQYGYAAEDLLKNDPFLRDRVLCLISRGRAADAKFVAKLHPGAKLFRSGPGGSCWALP